jgi:hypothetical protein
LAGRFNPNRAGEWRRSAFFIQENIMSEAAVVIKQTASTGIVEFNQFEHDLAESYQHFTGNPLDGAHSAMADVLGCIEVYRRITAPIPQEAASV